MEVDDATHHQPSKTGNAMARTMRATTRIDEQDEPKRRGRPSKHPMPFDSNVTDETVAEFGQRALAAKLDHEQFVEDAKKANGAYRAVLKDAKKAGVDPDAVVWWLKARKMEPEDLNRQINWQNRMAMVMNLPMGTQLGWDLETGETVAHVVDEKQLKRRRGRQKKATNSNGAGEA